jgi:hypothetical protein
VDGENHNMYALAPFAMTLTSATDLVNQSITKFNAEDVNNGNDGCNNGDTVGENIISDLKGKGFYFFNKEHETLSFSQEWDY